MISQYQLSLDGAQWIDVNTNFTVDTLPDRLPNQLAIVNSSLYNLLNCVPGQRSRIFQPTFGSMWLQFIHEPISDLTSKKMEIFMIQSIRKWVPQITLSSAQTRIDSDLNIPGYKVKIVGTTPFASSPQQVKFLVKL